MREKLEKAITDKIYVTENRVRREVTNKHNMEKVCMKKTSSNLHKYMTHHL